MYFDMVLGVCGLIGSGKEGRERKGWSVKMRVDLDRKISGLY
jgi:hypothetical protein